MTILEGGRTGLICWDFAAEVPIPLLLKPRCLTHCLGRWLPFPSVPLQTGLVIVHSFQPRRTIIRATIACNHILSSQIDWMLNGMQKTPPRTRTMQIAWINDHHLSGCFVQEDTCPGYLSFAVAEEMFFSASLYPADHSLLYLSRAGVIQLSPCPPLSCTSEQAAPSQRSWKDRFGLFSHPAVNLVTASNLGHALIPARPSCMSYVKQAALQSNDTRSSSVTPSFLPQAMPSLLFQALSPYSCLTCLGAESGAFKSFNVTWPTGLEEQPAPSRAPPQTTCSHIQMAVGKKKANCMLSNFLY